MLIFNSPSGHRERARQLAAARLNDAALFDRLSREHPHLTVLAVDPTGPPGRVIAVAYGRPAPRGPADEAVLQGIAVVADLARRGIGRAVLAAFEDAARRTGFQRVSVGSAAGPVERFYAACGYTARKVHVAVPVERAGALAPFALQVKALADGVLTGYVPVPAAEALGELTDRLMRHDPDLFVVLDRELGAPDDR